MPQENSFEVRRLINTTDEMGVLENAENKNSAAVFSLATRRAFESL